MKPKQPTPLEASFWLTRNEQGYLALILLIALIGLIGRYFILKNRDPQVYTPAGLEAVERETSAAIGEK